MKIKLYKIRTLVAILSPLYISICAALLLDLKLNMKLDCASVLYFSGLFFLVIACYISNELFRRCSNYGNIYDIQINEYVKDTTKEKPKRENIFDKCESNVNSKKRNFQYYGIFIFGALGLLLVIFSYLGSNNEKRKCEIENEILHQKVDSLKTANNEQVLLIIKLKSQIIQK